jgi:aspartyl-tRNA(Asn)/glutamyl-tRNA(Gln) amidotransferase subunit A
VFAARNLLSATLERDNCPKVDVLLHPSAICTAPRLSSADSAAEDASNGLDAYTQDVLTVPASLAGLPALSIPAGLGADGWPIGVTVVSQWGCDDAVLRMGAHVEQMLAVASSADTA